MKELCYCLAIVLACTIEWVRWKILFGKVKNLDKKYSVLIGFGLFVFVAVKFIGFDASFFLKSLAKWFVYGIECIGIRIVLYDPVLNIFMGRYIDHISHTTNSLTDQKQADFNINFWQERVIGLVITLVFSFLYQLLF
jgi:hypothetical protein